MTPFEHVATLFAFVYAVAAGHLLIRIGELIVGRASPLLFIGMANAILTVFPN